MPLSLSAAASEQARVLNSLAPGEVGRDAAVEALAAVPIDTGRVQMHPRAPEAVDRAGQRLRGAGVVERGGRGVMDGIERIHGWVSSSGSMWTYTPAGRTRVAGTISTPRQRRS